MSFAHDFDAHSAWRREQAQRLRTLADALAARDLLDAGLHERLERLQRQLQTDKVMVAFVAEVSRGKSELINAVFFAGYGRRIMPASAGRTTMCPTELGYDRELPPCLRLLPIETRLQPQSLLEWRSAPERWERIDLDVQDSEQLARAIEKVAEVQRVPVEQARALGFWHDDRPEDNPLPGADGLVEVPRWRHALINMAHPLLKQGLVVLDTPGLNAIGAEPELTVGLLPLAQAVVFVLAADAGVSKSDLAMWREHLAPAVEGVDARLVVLNKIDVLWDGLSTPAEIDAQIERQQATTAQVLGVEPAQVIAVSAQKGLVAKVRGDEGLLADSRLPDLERALTETVLQRRRDDLGGRVDAALAAVVAEIEQRWRLREREWQDQIDELDGLRGKNMAVIAQMRRRIEQEQRDFDAGGMRIQALRSVHLKLLRELFGLLGSQSLQAGVASLAGALRQPGVKLGIRRTYTDAFARLHATLDEARRKADEVQTMLQASFRSLNAEYGFALQLPGGLDLWPFAAELRDIERSHLQYLGLTNVLRLVQAEYADRLAKAVVGRLKAVFDAASAEVESWNKAAAAQLDAQLRERRRHFARRLETVHRIEAAAGALDERLAELQAQRESAARDVEALRRLLDRPDRPNQPDSPDRSPESALQPAAPGHAEQP
ncbi:dynamin family protein [Tepidimonas sp.]|uniref:dynamin family protein n=1 Tax=Tepidimonas sp. TaxID=2002775 RepID=UPI002FE2D9D2